MAAATPPRLRFGSVLSHPALVLALHTALLLLHDCAAKPTPPSRVAFRRRQHQIDAVYNFGDSLSDTGNRLRELGAGWVVGNLPYGETLGEPTGRCSDGLLMIDYLTNFLGLPHLPPYLDKSANFDHGANFAVAGATALDRAFFLDRGVNATFTNSSLSIQLQWFKTHLTSLRASKQDCEERLGRALFLVGEIGGNDYNYGLFVHTSLQDMKAYVPLVVGRIVDAVKELMDLGAARLVVPGNFPIGCLPCYLTLYEHGSHGLDQNGCIVELNEFSKFHNDRLQGAIDCLRRDHPGVTIEYADYFDAFLSLLAGADKYANFLGLPHLPPYLDKSANFDHGVNFAVAGATALDRAFFLDRGVNTTFTNSSLSVQLQWFKTHLISLCASKQDCEERLGRALFLVGEIGGNDYNYGLLDHTSLQDMKAYVPLVVGRTVDAVKELIGLGAARLVVPGNFPIGCLPCYLTHYEQGPHGLDQNGCVVELNEFSIFHNDRLQGAIDRLRRDHPSVTVEYADYYDAFLSLLAGATKYGFDQDSLFKACCGIGGAHNYDPTRTCGSRGVPTCNDPAKFISWDGLHLTQEAYKDLATQLFGSYLLGGKVVAA